MNKKLENDYYMVINIRKKEYFFFFSKKKIKVMRKIIKSILGYIRFKYKVK